MTRDELLRQRRQMRRRIKDVVTERRLRQLQDDVEAERPDTPAAA